MSEEEQTTPTNPDDSSRSEETKEMNQVESKNIHDDQNKQEQQNEDDKEEITTQTDTKEAVQEKKAELKEEQEDSEKKMPNQASTENSPKKIIIIGASGATGSQVLKKCLERGFEVTSIGRRKLIDSKALASLSESQKTLLKEVVVEIDFDSVEKMKDVPVEEFLGEDAAVCCLGTTTAVAKTEKRFRRIDVELVEFFAEKCSAAHIPHFSVVSSVSADPKSLFQYLRVQGDKEVVCEKQNFKRLMIYRPGSLDRGERNTFFQKIPSALGMAITVEKVAEGLIQLMLNDLTEGNSGKKICGNSEILKALKTASIKKV